METDILSAPVGKGWSGVVSKIPTTDNRSPDLKMSLVNYLDILMKYKCTPRVQPMLVQGTEHRRQVQVVGLANKAHPRTFRAEVATEEL